MKTENTHLYFPGEEQQPVDGLLVMRSWERGWGVWLSVLTMVPVCRCDGAGLGVIMLTHCVPLTTSPGHDGCHPLGGAQWALQNTALKRNISWSNSNPGIIDVGIELDCVIIWVTQLLTRLFLIKLLHMFSLSSQVLYTDLFIDGSALNYARHWRKFKRIFLINYDNGIWYTPVSKIYIQRFCRISFNV